MANECYAQSTRAVRLEFGLLENDQPVYKAAIDLDRNGEIGGSEKLDYDDNGVVNDAEAWSFFWRNIGSLAAISVHNVLTNLNEAVYECGKADPEFLLQTVREGCEALPQLSTLMAKLPLGPYLSSVFKLVGLLANHEPLLVADLLPVIISRLESAPKVDYAGAPMSHVLGVLAAKAEIEVFAPVIDRLLPFLRHPDPHVSSPCWKIAKKYLGKHPNFAEKLAPVLRQALAEGPLEAGIAAEELVKENTILREMMRGKK